MKKILNYLNMCIILLIAILVVGCTPKINMYEETSIEETSIEETSLEETPIEETSLENTSLEETDMYEDPYSLYQDLNIIRDNYRNYYEIFVYSFYDSDGDGIGDINGIREKLDYINDGNDQTMTDLGVDGIWLMPIMPSTTYHKYDVIDYYGIDPQYGSLEDFQLLLDECHKRDIKVIIDFVFNHTSTKHEWFVSATNYLKSLGPNEESDLSVNPYVDYYHFTKEYDGSETYHQVGNTPWYYEGVFWSEMPDLNLENSELRRELEAIAKYWMDLGVDGFRLDAAKEYYSGEKAKNIEVLNWFHDYVKSVNDKVYVVGEVWDSHDSIVEYYNSGITSLFNFPYARYNGEFTMTARQLGTSSARKFGKMMVSDQVEFSEANKNYIDAPFISNHDTTRISAQCVNNEDQMKMAAGLLLMSTGNPFVYYGEEIGMNSSGGKDENKRLPMYWSVTELEGITNKPMNADDVEQVFDPVDKQVVDPLSILNYYKRGIRLRNENPEIARGQVTFIEQLSTKTLCVIEKEYKGSKIVIIYNIDKEPITIDLKASAYESLNLRGYLDVDGTEISFNDSTLMLPKYGIVILK